MGELSKLPNIGKAVEEQLIEVGIYTEDELKQIGSKESWLKIQSIDESACINRLMALRCTSIPYGNINSMKVEARDIPQSYNSDPDNLNNCSAIDNAGTLQVDFAFATNDLLETAISKKTHSDGLYDFSENHMRYALGKASDTNKYAFDRDADEEGNIDMAIAYWTRGLNGYN